MELNYEKLSFFLVSSFLFSLLLSRFILVILAFLLFVFIDLLTHIQDVFDSKTTWKTWIEYYTCLLSYRLNALIPFSVAAATALLLPRIVRGNELIPLLSAGLSLQKIMAPFIFVTILLSCFLWINSQYIYPKAVQKYRQISDTDFGRHTPSEEESKLGIIFFKEGSRLFFKEHNSKEQVLQDTFWVRSLNCVLHIEHLNYFEDRIPEGHYVDVIERNNDGKMVKTTSYPFCELPELFLTKKTIKIAQTDPRDLSITELATQLVRFGSSSSERATDVIICFFQKLFFPLLACLAFLIPAPFCLSFERRIPQTLLLFLSLASLFCLQIILETASVLARAAPTYALFILLFPWVMVFYFVRQSIRHITA